MKTSKIKIRKANKEDIKEIIYLSSKLDEYGQKINSNLRKKSSSCSQIEEVRTMISPVFSLTEESLTKYCFCENPLFYSLVAQTEDKEETENKLIASVIYFYTFSSFTGKPTLYIEDIFVLEKYRGQGIGKKLFLELTLEANKRDCARIEWAVLDRNKESIEFYKSLGAYPLEDRTNYRLDLEKN